MRAGALGARAHGVNLAFLGSNADYRHIRLVASRLGGARHEIDYKHPARPGDRLIARTWVGPPSAATFERHTEILRARDDRLLARARSLWCPVHPASGRLRRIDSALDNRFYAR